MYTYCAHTHVCIDDIYVHTQIHAMCVHVYILIYLSICIHTQVGARTVGPPAWPKLVKQIQMLPLQDQYGTP